ncbi:MAG TPA: hypothetical protein VJT72_20775 [Pseudonocardiaceae bacterium]|nr:hypothetical protein [Pseudonocardiaceae bacterium]
MPQPAARPVMLVRYRPGVIGETARTVHVIPLPTGEQAGAVSTLCGTTLMHGDIEIVGAGEGMPCTLCVVNQALGTAPAGEPDADRADTAGLAAGGFAYQEWDWPVTHHRDQVRLRLHGDVSAIAILIPLGIQVTRILVRRSCAPAVLAHPYAPDHHIVLTGERSGVPLPWPGQVHRVTGVLMLPPTVTPRGPITWTRPPRADSLQLCREIDLFGALRTALNDSPPGDPHASRPR